MEWKVPKNVANICSFMGLVGYYQFFIERFSKISFPITSLQHKGRVFKWTSECQTDFKQLKQLLTTNPILKVIYPNKEF